MTQTTWSLEEFEPKTVSSDRWRRFHEYRNLIHQEVRPNDPDWPNDLVEEQLKIDSPFRRQWRYEVIEGDRLIGFLEASTSTTDDPAYESSKHLLSAGGSVHADHRRHGIATSLLAKVLEIMDETSTSVLTIGTETEPGHEFLRWAGFEEKQTMAENRLDFGAIDWALVDKWVEVGIQTSPETKLEIYPERLPREFWEEYSESITPLLNTMPFDELDHGEIVMSVKTLEEIYERVDSANAHHHVILTREPDGTISGMTDMIWVPGMSDRAMQGFTGVRPDTRGRGLGKLLKASMLKLLKEKYGDLAWIVTGNAHSNDPMLAINHQLGFREYKGATTFQAPKETVAAKIA